MLEILFVVCTLLAAICAIVGESFPLSGRVFAICVVADLIIAGIKLFG